jgi:uncharacterized radical SAM superfamily protein
LIRDLAGNKKGWNENAAWAVLVTNVGRRKRKDVPITVMGDAVKFLVEKYGTNDAVSKEAYKRNLKLSREMVRNFYDISRLDEVTRRIVDKLGKIDVARRLYAISDIKRRHQTVKAISDLDSFTARHVIEYVLKSPKLSVEECKRKILAQKTERIEVNALVIPLAADEFAALKKVARELGLNVTETARRAVGRMIQAKLRENK